MKKKSHLDENTISAYIEKKLDEKDFISAEEHISNCKECLNALNTVIEAKKLMGNEENFIELPYTLSEKVKEEIEKLTSGKIKLVLKIIKNGIEEIMNSLKENKQILNISNKIMLK